MQVFQREIKETVAELVKSVELLGSQVEEFVLQAHEASSERRKEARLNRLQQEVAQLRRQDQELRSLSCTPDDVRFLEVCVTWGSTSITSYQWCLGVVWGTNKEDPVALKGRDEQLKVFDMITKDLRLWMYC